MIKLSNVQKLDLVLEDLGKWVAEGDSDCSMVYAYNNGYLLHAANLWLSSGALSEDIETQIKGLKISRIKEMKEIKKICSEAYIYICQNCNHQAFLDSHVGSTVSCSNCLGIAQIKKGVK